MVSSLISFQSLSYFNFIVQKEFGNNSQGTKPFKDIPDKATLEEPQSTVTENIDAVSAPSGVLSLFRFHSVIVVNVQYELLKENAG